MKQGDNPQAVLQDIPISETKMDLNGSWQYFESIARNRLAHNKTKRHVSMYGEGIETIGAAGELAARRFLGLEEKLHQGFDGGHDFVFAGMSVDVKATVLTPNIEYRFLQWPEKKPIRCQIILMTAVDPISRHARYPGICHARKKYGEAQSTKLAGIPAMKFRYRNCIRFTSLWRNSCVLFKER